MKILGGMISLLVLFLLLSFPWQSQGSFAEIKSAYRSSERTFLDRKGRVMDRVRIDSSKRRVDWIALSDLNPMTKEAILKVEDKRFYSHHGVDWLAFVNLPRDWIKTRKTRGASTLSMQLSTVLRGRKDFGRKSLFAKTEQILSALRIEWSWSKDEIFEAYLNLVPFRSDLEGIRAASLGLLQKEPHGLNSAESYLLASLIALPNAQANRVARKACQFVDEASCKGVEKIAEKVLNSRPFLPKEESVAPHYLRFIKSEEAVVQTSLDQDLQKVAMDGIQDQLNSLKLQNVKDAAVLAIDYRSGEVLSYIGSSGKLSKANEVDGVRSLRQAGSTLKPLLYAKAFDQNILEANSLLNDSPMQIQTPNGVYSPQNYDERYKGIVTVKEALASSLNIPAVRAIDLIGVDSFYRLLEELRFRLLNRQTYGHSLALGSLDVSLWQLVHAYAVLARGGIDGPMGFDKGRMEAFPFRNLFQAKSTESVSQILSDKSNRSSTFGLDNMLATPYWTAVKTGTSKDMRDNWCIGYSGRYVVGVWVGNFDGSPMWNVSGVSGAAPIWRRVMDALEADQYQVLSVNNGNEIPEEHEYSEALADRESSTILYPMDKTVIAYDPDIPREQQVLVFEAEKSRTKRTWKLDGKAMKKSHIRLDDLSAGMHRLEIWEGSDRLLDQVRFEMRGQSH